MKESSWLAGNEFSLADIGYAPYITRLDHLQLQFLWDKRPHIPDWYDRLRERRAYTEALEKWFNANYLPLMKEKGLEVRDKVKAIVGGITLPEFLKGDLWKAPDWCWVLWVAFVKWCARRSAT